MNHGNYAVKHTSLNIVCGLQTGTPITERIISQFPIGILAHPLFIIVSLQNQLIKSALVLINR